LTRNRTSSEDASWLLFGMPIYIVPVDGIGGMFLKKLKLDKGVTPTLICQKKIFQN